ncbi:VCBS repeat-containing protein [bacterium]|nr:VCBS repeat-containing protein [bacterium]
MKSLSSVTGAFVFALLALPPIVSAQDWAGFPALNEPSGSGQGPFAVTTADFNEDGILDLAVAHYAADEVIVYLGEEQVGLANGTFAAPVAYTAGFGPTNVSHGDFNEDGVLDLAVTNIDSNNVSVLLGNGSGGVGDGTFGTAANYGVGFSPTSVTSGDFDEDGIADLVVSNHSSDDVSVLLGNGSAGAGDGTFGAASSYSTGTNPYRVITGDFNEDDILDLAVANKGSANVSILFGGGGGGVGDGTFGAPNDYAVGTSPYCIASEDLNGDTITDLVISNYNSNNASVLIGKGLGGVGDGTFAAAVNYAVGSTPRDIKIDDLNDDGIWDLIVPNGGGDDVAVLFGNAGGGGGGGGSVGDGTFQAASFYATGDNPINMVTGDFNRDGITDVVTAHFNGGDIGVLLGGGSGGVGDGTLIAPDYPTISSFPRRIATGDFDEDGIADLAIASASNKVEVLLGNGSGGIGDGTFDTAVPYALSGQAYAITVGDFNDDDIMDIAATITSPATVAILLGDGTGGVGDGTFGTPSYYSTGTGPYSVDTGDFNGDDVTDLVVASNGSSSVSVLIGTDAGGGVGDGTFAAGVAYSLPAGPQDVTVADFNGDLIDDLATANYSGDNVSILTGVGDGTFNTAVDYLAGDNPYDVAAEDLDGDGIKDLVVTNYISNDVSILIGNGSGGIGDGTFAGPVNYAVEKTPHKISIDDFNADGITDVAISHIQGRGVSVMLGTGNGTFPDSLHYLTDDGPMNMAVADFNGDGLPDIATPTFYTASYTVLLNLGILYPAVEVTPPSLDFGSVELGDPAVALSSLVQNTGDGDLRTTATLTNDGGGAFSIASVPASELIAGTSDTLTIEFAPNAVGPISGEVSLETNTSSGTLLIALSGTGVDSQAPSSQVTGPSGALTQPSPIISVEYTASDGSGSGVDHVELFYTYTSTRRGVPYNSAGTFTSSPIAFDTTSTGGSGTYEFYVVATDGAGNTEPAPGTPDVTVNFNDVSRVDDWSVLDR